MLINTSVVMGSCCSKPNNDEYKSEYKSYNIDDDYDYIDLNEIENNKNRLEFGPLYMIDKETSDINTLDIRKRYRQDIKSVYF
ncbi:hypothetical protein NY_014-037 [NY_014 poxvirus]|uniref:hypothetical protein n=1 Tax=NY_014 poxvirus TaxID=2025360 RepID=UPI000B9A09E1|nr:hypothetical protein CKM51_gp037 [NY_014 poxvirus]AST09438.1 hypothetical protein NY_014-037 [NY_014 poxvirus]